MLRLSLVARRLLVASALAYAGSILAFTALWHYGPSRFWWLEVSNIFAPHLFLPLGLLVPVALVVRSWWLRGAAALVLAAFVLSFGGLFVPRAAPIAQASTLRVMTFNQLVANDRMDAIIDVIRANDADVVALQELSPAVAAAVQQQLATRYPYQVLAPAPTPSGLGLLSRYRLEPLPSSWEARYQKVRVHVGNQALTLLNVHPPVPLVRSGERRVTGLKRLMRSYDAARRDWELHVLLDDIDHTAGPLLVVGDFNLSDREPLYHAFDAQLHDAYREANIGFGFTFPNRKSFKGIAVPFPLIRIDYVWSAGGVTPMTAAVQCEDLGSDHCALVADVALGAGPAAHAALHRPERRWSPW